MSTIQKRLVKFCSVSLKDNQDSQPDYSIIEPYWVIHPDNCHLVGCRCTSRKKSAELEEKRKQWWKNRRHSTAMAVEAPERDYWDPTMEDW